MLDNRNMFNQGFSEAGVDLKHYFSSGVYAKEVRIPAGVILEQHSHEFDHLSILASGSVLMRCDGWVESISGPSVVEITAGKQHQIEALTDSVWFCVHQTDETDATKIDRALVAHG